MKSDEPLIYTIPIRRRSFWGRVRRIPAAYRITYRIIRHHHGRVRSAVVAAMLARFLLLWWLVWWLPEGPRIIERHESLASCQASLAYVIGGTTCVSLMP